MKKKEFLYYWEMPEHYRWNGNTSTWEQRVRRLRVIGRRFCGFPECFYLRVLLYHVKNAKSFEDLKTVDNIVYSTYKKACLAHGLEFDDKQWFDALEKSVLSKLPCVIRIVFTQILVYGNPADPKALWERFKNQLAEDFILHARQNNLSKDLAVKRAYRIIASKLNTMAREGRNFSFWEER